MSYITGGGPGEFIGMPHFQFTLSAFCFVFVLEDVISQLPDLAKVTDTGHGATVFSICFARFILA